MISHVQWLDAEPERRKQREKERIKYELALVRAIDMLYQYTGSCPMDLFEWDNDCENNCNDEFEKCWRAYLMREKDNGKD